MSHTRRRFVVGHIVDDVIRVTPRGSACQFLYQFSYQFFYSRRGRGVADPLAGGFAVPHNGFIGEYISASTQINHQAT